MTKIIEYNVSVQNIELASPAMLVAGTVNEYTARFSFDAEWDGYQRVAVFNSDGTEREQLLTDDTCMVPWEVLLPGAYLKVGVYGTKDGSRLPTIWTSHRQYIHDGAGPTEEAADPSPVLAEQILQRMGDLDALKTEDKSSLVAAINEIWMSGGGGASVTDAAIDESGHLIITLSTGKTIDAGYAVGPAGPIGPSGENGKNGQDGAPGKDGADGLPGKDGKDGDPGADGKDGVGIQSVTQTTTSTEDGGANIVTVTKTDGTTSTFEVRNGRRGSIGPAGADGKDGSQGPAGADGKTAYQYAQEGGYAGTEQEFTEKMAAEIPEAYTLPIASSTVLGGVQPVAKTDAMTQSVGVDAAGALFTEPGSGGGSAGSAGYETIVDFTAEEAVTVFQTDAITDTDIINKIKNASILMISIYVPNNSEDAESTSNGTVDIAFYNGSWSSAAWTGLSVIPNPTQAWCKYGSKDILICMPGKSIHASAYAYEAAWGAFYNSGVPAPEVKTIIFPKGATKSGAYFKVTGSQPLAKGTRFRVGVLV